MMLSPALAFTLTLFVVDQAPTKPAPPAPAAAPAPAPTTSTPPTAPSGPPPPAAELAQLKVFAGKWTCTGKTLDTPYGKAHPISATMDNKVDLNGYWHMWRYAEKKTKDNPTPYVMASFVGFDATKKALVRTDVDGLGMITHLSTNGFDGDKIVFAGDVMGPQKTQFRDSMTKKSPKEISSVLEMTGPDGKWLTLAETTCKKK